MKKNRKFKKGQLVQNIDTQTIFIFVKYTVPKRAHLIELNNFGDPIGVVLMEYKYLDIPKNFPETFSVIVIN